MTYIATHMYIRSYKATHVHAIHDKYNAGHITTTHTDKLNVDKMLNSNYACVT